MSTRFAPWRADHHRPTGEVLAGLAAKQDLAAVVELAEAHSGVKGGWAERLCDDLSGEGRALFAAWANGTVAGYGRVRRFTPPEQAPANTAPAGWYLGGLLVAPQWRRCGAGAALTQARLAWVAERAEAVWYFANANNAASLALHAAIGFEEVTRDFSFPGVSFEGGIGVLCRRRLRPEDRQPGGRAARP